MFHTGPKITQVQNELYELDWGLGTPVRVVGSRDLGRPFMACRQGNLPSGVYRQNITRPWVNASYVPIPRGEEYALYSCSSASWDNTAPGCAPCRRPADDGIGSTNWKRWC